MSLIPSTVRQSIQNTLDSIMQYEGQDCVLYFPPIETPISGGRTINPSLNSDISYNVWSDGSPSPMTNILNNTYEDGSAYVSIEPTGLISMVIYPNPSKFNTVFPIGERKPDGLIVTRGYVADVESVMNCTRMETYTKVGTDHFKYKLEGEPVFPGTLVADCYMYCLWSRL